MLTNNLKQLLGITLKNFFDIDITVFINLFLSILTLLAVVKLLVSDILKLAADGWNSVKQDTIRFKESLLEARERWENSTFRDTLINTFRSVKYHASDNGYHTGS